MKSSRKTFSKTKIICTLGPSSNTFRIMSSLIKAGMDLARINFSHGTFDEHLKTFYTLRKVAKQMGVPIGVIQDLQGPKIRIGDLKKKEVNLKPRTLVTITAENVKGDENLISTTYQRLPNDVKKNEKILIDDGKIELQVKEVKGRNVVCKVITGGVLTPRKGMNLPNTKISSPSLTDKDKEDLSFAFEHDVDYVALSFIRKSSDISELRNYIIRNGPKGRRIPIIAKIEKPEAVSEIDVILKEADSIMIARGDLGVEMSPEDVPLIQKMIVTKCKELGKPVIIATQMLESMISNPRPTRAEANDVANAVFDGVDAVMLSGETSVGKFPVQAVEVMERIICKTELELSKTLKSRTINLSVTHPYDPISSSACLLAEQVGAKIIVTITHSGETAIRIAKHRPSACIIAVTDREKIMRRLNIIWGIRGLIVENLKRDTDKALKLIQSSLLKEGYVKKGDIIVVTLGIPLFKRHTTNTIKVGEV